MMLPRLAQVIVTVLVEFDKVSVALIGTEQPLMNSFIASTLSCLSEKEHPDRSRAKIMVHFISTPHFENDAGSQCKYSCTDSLWS
jgi:hypothetical protein